MAEPAAPARAAPRAAARTERTAEAERTGPARRAAGHTVAARKAAARTVVVRPRRPARRHPACADCRAAEHHQQRSRRRAAPRRRRSGRCREAAGSPDAPRDSRSADTGALPSAFMTTTVQSPLWMGHWSVWVPGPPAWPPRRSAARAASEGAPPCVSPVVGASGGEPADVGDLIVGHAVQVVRHVRRGTDADEQRASSAVDVALTWTGPVARDPVAGTEVQLDVRGDERVPAGFEGMGGRVDVSLTVACRIEPEKDAPRHQQGQADQGSTAPR